MATPRASHVRVVDSSFVPAIACAAHFPEQDLEYNTSRRFQNVKASSDSEENCFANIRSTCGRDVRQRLFSKPVFGMENEVQAGAIEKMLGQEPPATVLVALSGVQAPVNGRCRGIISDGVSEMPAIFQTGATAEISAALPGRLRLTKYTIGVINNTRVCFVTEMEIPPAQEQRAPPVKVVVSLGTTALHGELARDTCVSRLVAELADARAFITVKPLLEAETTLIEVGVGKEDDVWMAWCEVLELVQDNTSLLDFFGDALCVRITPIVQTIPINVFFFSGTLAGTVLVGEDPTCANLGAALDAQFTLSAGATVQMPSKLPNKWMPARVGLTATDSITVLEAVHQSRAKLLQMAQPALVTSVTQLRVLLPATSKKQSPKQAQAPSESAGQKKQKKAASEDTSKKDRVSAQKANILQEPILQQMLYSGAKEKDEMVITFLGKL